MYTTPSPTDVLLGRSKVAFECKANQDLRRTIASKVGAFAQTRKQKSMIVRGVFRSVLEGGGRFLKYDAERKQWYQANQIDAKRRVSFAFRDASRAGKVKCMEKLGRKISTKHNGEPQSDHTLSLSDIFASADCYHDGADLSSDSCETKTNPQHVTQNDTASKSLVSLMDILQDDPLTIVPDDPREPYASDPFTPRRLEEMMDAVSSNNKFRRNGLSPAPTNNKALATCRQESFDDLLLMKMPIISLRRNASMLL